jgi:hypothetical protein
MKSGSFRYKEHETKLQKVLDCTVKFELESCLKNIITHAEKMRTLPSLFSIRSDS